MYNTNWSSGFFQLLSFRVAFLLATVINKKLLKLILIFWIFEILVDIIAYLFTVIIFDLAQVFIFFLK